MTLGREYIRTYYKKISDRILIFFRPIRAIINRFTGRQKRVFSAALILLFLYVWTTPQFKELGTIKILDRNGQLIYEQAGSTGRRQAVGYSAFPRVFVDAVVAAEDEAFFSHPGIDPKAIVRSLAVNIKSGSIVTGASTITQQVARLNAPATSAFLPLRILQKIREAAVAVRLSLTHSKTEILTLYLNNVYLGNHTYGAQAGAQYYFHKNIDRVSLNEAAYLAGIIASPGKYDPYLHYPEGEKRKNYVLSRMGANGFITADQLAEAASEPVEFSDPSGTMTAPHFVDYVLSLLPDLHIRERDISVHTTLEPGTFALTQRIARDWVLKLKDIHNVHNASVVILDNKTGAILSMLGGINYFDEEHDGQVNLAISPRQPGSAIKPVTYAAAFAGGASPGTLIYDVKQPYNTSTGEGFIPNNFGDTYHGLVLAREALASSYNLPAVEMLHRAGIPAFRETARALGITYPESKTYDYAITLGAGEVSLLELTNAYATLARMGKYLPTHAITEIRDHNGHSLYTYSVPQPESRLGTNGDKIAYLITDILADPLARMPGFGEKNYLTLSRTSAVKTGTTTDWHDILTVGYTPSYTVGVWMGNNNNEEMRQISSATGAAPVWNQIFEEFLKDKPVEEFRRPDGLVEKEICKLSGDLYDGLCPEKKTEIYIKGSEPVKISALHKHAAIDTRNNLLASKDCPERFVTWNLLVDYPPEVYDWAVKNKKPYLPHAYSPLCSPGSNSPEEEDPFIEITNPKNKSTYQNAPLLIRNQGIVFEVSVSQNILAVEWYVDGKLFSKVTAFPFSAVFPLQNGNYLVYARGSTKTKSIDSQNISFTVTQ